MADSTALDLVELSQRKRIIVCCGSGGVGKTTTAAALGYLAATRGRNVLVMTIDPARRLAQALGLDALGNEPQQIQIAAASQAPIGAPQAPTGAPQAPTGAPQAPAGAPGRLHAMMLDSKRTFDALIERYAPSAAARETIFANRYYHHLSNSLAGSREFMAMEKVYEMVQSSAYDLLIVDTPPAQHALDFLEAPERLFDLFEGSFVNLLLQPYRVAGRIGFDIFRRSSDRALKILERLTGYDVLADLSDFFLAFAGMSAGFKERSQRVLTMLRQPETSFLLICAPESASLAQVDRFFTRLSADSMPIGGVIVNRVHQADSIPDGASLTPTDISLIQTLPDRRLGGADLGQRLLDAYRDHLLHAARDAAAIEATGWAQSQIPVHRLPHFDRDLHSLADIAALAAYLRPQTGTATAPA